MSDELTGIFDSLTPGDFDRLTSNVHEWRLRKRHQQRTFKQWVNDNLLHVHTAFDSNDGDMNPFAVLENEDWGRLFVPDDDESLGDFIDRLHMEAVGLGAQRFFIAKQTLVDVAVPGGGNEEVGDMTPEQQEHAKLGVLYYGQVRTRVENEHRSGVIFATTNTLGEHVEAPPTQRIPLFDQVLDQVPFFDDED